MIDRALEALAATLGSRLAACGWKIATAESCTGGLVAGAITAIAGSSGWFEYGFVVYANAAKVALLGVDETILAAHGAVSPEAARAMAEGALARSGADLAVAITGVAGPVGGTADKPVGMVCFAWAVRDGGVAVETRRFGGDRAAIRLAAVEVALQGVIARVPPR
jgi:nicotinamide-nucleotide amidase